MEQIRNDSVVSGDCCHCMSRVPDLLRMREDLAFCPGSEPGAIFIY